MAASFDVYLRWIFVCLLISQPLILQCKRHKHPPVVAFFQGKFINDLMLFEREFS